MSIHRLIYRLDFQTNYDLMDRPGEVARLLETTSRGLFKDIGESGEWRSTVGKRSDGSATSLELTVDPKSIVATLESVEGIRSDALGDAADFKGLLDVMDAVCRGFKIAAFTRAGFRQFLLESTGHGADWVCEHCAKLVAPAVPEAIKRELGSVGDIGFVFDGKSDDKLLYHCRFGPFRGRSEAERYFVKTGKGFPSQTHLDLIFDIDLYEENFSYSQATTRKWWRPLADKADRLTKAVRTSLG